MGVDDITIVASGINLKSFISPELGVGYPPMNCYSDDFKSFSILITNFSTGFVDSDFLSPFGLGVLFELICYFELNKPA